MFSVTRTVAPPTMLIDRRTVLLPSSRERDSVFVPSPGKKKEERKKKILSCAQRSKKTKFQIWTVFLISSIPGVPSRRDKEREIKTERETF